MHSENYSENFIVVNNQYNPLSPNSFGNFEISTVLIKTSFSKSDENYSETFKDFQDNRLIIAQRLAALNGDSSGTVDEFEPNPDGMFDSQVLMVGDAYERKFSQKGTYDYYCMLHTWMTGQIIVEDS